MKLLALSCNHCGAPMEVPPKTKFVTCDYCQSRLAVHRSGGAAYTEVLEALDERTQQIAEDVEIIKLQNKLERLDREWMDNRAELMIRGKDGQLRVPDKAGSSVMVALVVAFGVVWTIVAGAMFAPMAIFGLIFIAFAVWGGISGFQKAEDYQRRQRSYQTRRRQLLDELQQRSR